MANDDNLKPYKYKKGQIINIELGRKGGIASGIARRKKKWFNENRVSLSEDTKQLLIEKFKSNYDKICKKVEKAILKCYFSDELSQQELKSFKVGYIQTRLSKNKRYKILKQANFKCKACGKKPDKNNDVKLDIDHIIPLAKGGTNKSQNLQVLCFECNMSKGTDE